MSSRKMPTSSKSTDIVEKRISQLFKDLREASGNVRLNNNEEQAQHKRADHQDLLDKNSSHAFSEAFLDSSSIPPPEPAITQTRTASPENVFNIIKGFMLENEIIEPVWSLDEGFKNRISSSSQLILRTGMNTEPETILVQIPMVNPTTTKRMIICCEIERTKLNHAWNESDMSRIKNILLHLEKLLQQRQY